MEVCRCVKRRKISLFCLVELKAKRGRRKVFGDLVFMEERRGSIFVEVLGCWECEMKKKSGFASLELLSVIKGRRR